MSVGSKDTSCQTTSVYKTFPPGRLQQYSRSEDAPNEHAGALRNFINDIGGIENAYAAVKVLSQLEERNDQ